MNYEVCSHNTTNKDYYKFIYTSPFIVKTEMIKEFFKDTLNYLPALAIPAIVGLLTIPIVTHLFPPGDYGNYSLTITTVSLFATFLSWASVSIIRFYPAYQRDSKIYEFNSNIIKLTFISILVVSLIFICILIFARSFMSPELYSYLGIGIFLNILTCCFNVLTQFLRIKGQANWYSGFTVWKSIAGIGFGVLLVKLFHLGVEGLLYGNILSLAISLPFLLQKSVGKISLKLKLSASLSREVFKYGFPLVVTQLAAWLLNLSDRYILGFFRGSTEVGIYSAGYGISEKGITLILSAITLASGPMLINIWEKEGKDKSCEFLEKLTRYYIIICLPVVVGLSVLAYPIMHFFTVTEYIVGYTIFPFVSLGLFFFGLQWIFQSAFRFYKKTYLTMCCISTSGLLNIGLNFGFVPKYGFMAAAVTTFISYVFLLLMVVVFSRKLFIWKFPFKSLVKVAAASAIMGMIVYPVGNNMTSFVPINLILSVFVGVVVYTVMLFLMGEPSQKEIQTLQLLKAKFLKKR
ncbi:MAG: lipopolysaccharide biosynthesis protein [Candidatus Cloacimonadia bacterium]